MTETLAAYVARCIECISLDLRRHRLVFLQLGAGHDVAREALLAELPGKVVPVTELIDAGASPHLGEPSVVVDNVELLSRGRDKADRLGALREVVMELVDNETNVMLVSRVPRARYGDVPGSSILDDAIACFLPPVIEPPSGTAEDVIGWRLPAVGLGGSSWRAALVRVFEEVGGETLAALDAALFESHLADDRSLQLLRPLDLDALRGAGLLMLDDGHNYKYIDTRVGDVRNGLADALSACTTPQNDFPIIAEGLWSIERMIRHKARAAAIAQFGETWRKQALYGDLPMKVLERARGDAYPAARSVGDLRDPLEWLTLGELLDLLDHSPYDLLNISRVVWRKLAGDLLPIRNRLSHMRMLRSTDGDTVRLWLVQAERLFG